MIRCLVALVIVAVILAAGCGGSPEATPTPAPTASPAPTAASTPTGPAGAAEAGDAVKVHYTGTLDDGSVFDSSAGRNPLEFTIGDGTLISGFDNAVVGMMVGESKTVVLPPEEAYGPYREELIFEVDRSELPEGIIVGQYLQGTTAEGQITLFEIIEIKESTVTLDGNHKLAGETLTFEIELVEIL